MPFEVIRNDITKVSCDAIVNTANPKPLIGAGTDYAIYKAAGAKTLLAEREKIGVIEPGDVRATPGFKLKAKYIFHAVAPAWHGGEQGELMLLESCYRKSLELAEKLGLESIAFPLIGAGTYGIPKDKALSVAIGAIQNFLFNHEIHIILVVFNKDATRLSGRIFDNVKEYVDDHYVNEKEHAFPWQNRRDSRQVDLDEMAGRATLSSAVPREISSKRPNLFAKASIKQLDKIQLSEIEINPQKTFQERLFEIIDERQLSGPEVYKNYISKQVYSKIQSDKDYHPNKFTAIALCLSLHLSLEDTQDLLSRAGWTLSPSRKADLIVKACILNEEYNLININIILFDMNCEPLEQIK